MTAESPNSFETIMLANFSSEEVSQFGLPHEGGSHYVYDRQEMDRARVDMFRIAFREGYATELREVLRKANSFIPYLKAKCMYEEARVAETKQKSNS